MKRNLVNFTRGSQLLGHFSFMFAAGLKGPLIIAAIGISWTSWWTISAGLSDHETYLVWMRIYAAIYGFMEFDPAKQVALETGLGGTVQLPIIMLDAYPPVIRAWDHLLDLLGDALVRSALLLVPAFVLFYWFAARFGNRSKERKHERGAMLVTLPELVDELRGHNQRERARELSSVLGWKWHLCSPKELSAAFPYRPSHLATVVYPWRLEQSHAMLIGTTGMGKTVAMSDMIAEARAKGQRCVVFDLTGAFIEHFYEADRDIILNPLDARCPQWSLFDECRTEGEFWAAAEALVPHDGGGEAQFWVIAARALFVEFCLKLVAEGRGTNAALACELMTADLSRVHAMMRGTIADPLTAPEAARMAESIRAVFNVNAKALKLLPTSGRRFSVRDWIKEGAHEDEGTNAKRSGSMVFISARYVDMSVCAQLLTLWLDTAMNTLMTMPRTKDLKCWFFIDELGALQTALASGSPAQATGSMTRIKELCQRFSIVASLCELGDLTLAHQPKRVADLEEEAEFLKSFAGQRCELLSTDALKERGCYSPTFYGGLWGETGLSVHPLNYARGLARAAAGNSVRIHGRSRVVRWEERDGRHILTTERGGRLFAKHVLVATNGFTDERVVTPLAGRVMPALSAIIVTRPLTEAEQKAQGWTSRVMAYDTRRLVHYFRLLPDGRFLFGGRGGTDASNWGLEQLEKRLRRNFELMFPSWAHVAHTHFWRGLVCLSRNLVPYVGPLDRERGVWTSVAYHGAGLAMGTWSGRAVADLIAGRPEVANLPRVMSSGLPKFPLPAFRPVYLKGAYLWYGIDDEWR